MTSLNRWMFLMARESRGMTQSELGEVLGLAQGTISKVESGALPPTDELASKYSVALNLPRELFSLEYGYRYLPVTFYRKRLSIGKGEIKRIEANALLRRIFVHRLQTAVELPAVKLPRLILAASHTPETLAQDLRRQWQIPPGPIENLVTILEDHGIIVLCEDFGTDMVDGFSLFDVDDPMGVAPIVLINQSIPGDRQRFTMAHELAHMVLHHHLEIAPDTSEAEADLFASEFLVPSDEIAPHLQRIDMRRLSELKAYWKVSMQSLLVKAGRINRMTPPQKQRLWRQLAAQGWRKDEPVTIPYERPGLVLEALAFMRKDLGYTQEQIDRALLVLREVHLDPPGRLRLVSQQVSSKTTPPSPTSRTRSG